MKLYNVQVQLLGSVAVVTLCGGERTAAVPPIVPLQNVTNGGAASGRRLDRALDALPPWVCSLVLDLDGVGDRYPVAALTAVREWAEARLVYVVTLGADPTSAHLPDLRSFVPSATRDGRTGSAVMARHALALRALERQAAGIRRARKDVHPCRDGP
ncbi:hypothetical protein [Streptomyces sp. NPDC048560]|uniref:hypothetical protein n=1 Tax=Streptomyces sp. NPDC048560 TaxID=3155488 RepID=UPI003412090D